MEREYQLANNVYLVAKYFNGQRVVHIRQYDEMGGKRYPTKTGICLSATRFASLLCELDTIDEAYKYVSGSEKQSVTVHIGGALYASVSSGFKCINLRYFWRAPNNKILPTKQGISLTIPAWNNLIKCAAELRDMEEDIKSTQRCVDNHINQLGFVNCGECNRFFDPIDPPCLPQPYCPMLKCLDGPAKKKLKLDIE
jgi:Transcriptional Coactivator p15 (PC4)